MARAGAEAIRQQWERLFEQDTEKFDGTRAALQKAEAA